MVINAEMSRWPETLDWRRPSLLSLGTDVIIDGFFIFAGSHSVPSRCSGTADGALPPHRPSTFSALLIHALGGRGVAGVHPSCLGAMDDSQGRRGDKNTPHSPRRSNLSLPICQILHVFGLWAEACTRGPQAKEQGEQPLHRCATIACVSFLLQSIIFSAHPSSQDPTDTVWKKEQKKTTWKTWWDVNCFNRSLSRRSTLI